MTNSKHLFKEQIEQASKDRACVPKNIGCGMSKF